MFILPSRPQYRAWKICHKGAWHNVYASPKNEAELKTAICKRRSWTRCDIFHSTSLYINPESVHCKKDRPIFVSSDFVCDFDSEDVEQARKDAMYTYNVLSMYNYWPSMIKFSGNKGFHLIYTLKDKRLSTIPISQRAQYIKDRNQRFLNKILIRNAKGDITTPKTLDLDVALDPYRVIRLAGSINQKSGFYCIELTRKQLFSHIDDIRRLAMPPNIIKAGQRQVKGADEAEPAPLSNRACVQSSLRTKPTLISNKVKGTKDRFIPVFKFPLDYEIWKALFRMKGLGTIYRFEDAKWLYLISLKPLQPIRIQKLIKQTRCKNDSHICYFPTKMVYKCKYFNEAKIISKPHAKLIRILTEETPQGTVGVNELTTAVVRDG